jgi:hypothetical protein
MNVEPDLQIPRPILEAYHPNRFALRDFIGPKIHSKELKFLANCDSFLLGQEAITQMHKFASGQSIHEITFWEFAEACSLTSHSNLKGGKRDLKNDSFGHTVRTFAIVAGMLNPNEDQWDKDLLNLIDSAHYFGTEYRYALISVVLAELVGELDQWATQTWDAWTPYNLDREFMKWLTVLVYLLSLDWSPFSELEMHQIGDWYHRVFSFLKAHPKKIPTRFVDQIPIESSELRLNWVDVYRGLSDSGPNHEMRNLIRDLLNNPDPKW